MKICAIFNIFPSYRKAIYQKMSSELPIDFFFGNASNENIALANPSILSKSGVFLKNIYKGKKLVWQRKAIRYALSKKYSHYILTGNTGIISNWVIILISKLLGRKTILWSHGLYGNEKGFLKLKNKLYLKLASHVFVYSERGRQILMQEGLNESKVTVIYNSLDFEYQIKLSERVGDTSFARNYFGNDNPLVSFIGRVTPQKKVDQLLKAISICKSNYNVIIVGNGECRDELEKLAENLGIIDKVWFYGECYDESMLATIISNSVLCVSPGNCGLNAIESLTYGTPLITHNNFFNQMPEVEAVEELCNVANIDLFFKENDIESLAETIDRNINQNYIGVSEKARQIIYNKWNANNQISIMVRYLSN